MDRGAKTANIIAGNLDIDLNAADTVLPILHIMDCNSANVSSDLIFIFSFKGSIGYCTSNPKQWP